MKPIVFNHLSDNSPFQEPKKIFEQLLRLRDEQKLPGLLNEFRTSLEEIETLKPALLLEASTRESDFFIEVFQFETLADAVIWEKAPGVYKVIGEEIDKRPEYESLFRKKVNEEKLGLLLKFIK